MGAVPVAVLPGPCHPPVARRGCGRPAPPSGRSTGRKPHSASCGRGHGSTCRCDWRPKAISGHLPSNSTAPWAAGGRMQQLAQLGPLAIAGRSPKDTIHWLRCSWPGPLAAPHNNRAPQARTTPAAQRSAWRAWLPRHQSPQTCRPPTSLPCRALRQDRDATTVRDEQVRLETSGCRHAGSGGGSGGGIGGGSRTRHAAGQREDVEHRIACSGERCQRNGKPPPGSEQQQSPSW